MGAHSCSTFLLKTVQELLVGHNLDDDIEVPGMVVINPRGIAKQNLSWEALKTGPFIKEPRLEWVSEYGSLTYNTMGKEFPDGGLNEAGLYVGEMTLFGTVYPSNPNLPKLYHHAWIQYLLDNFATVAEALSSLTQIQPSGHCQWHFFLADGQGNAAVLEFLEGKPVIHQGDELPYPVLCNRSYQRDMDEMKKYTPFGGDQPLPMDDCENDPRFPWAVSMLKEFPVPGVPAVERAFAILQQMDCGNNKWSVVYDIKKARMYFHTYRARSIRFIDLALFDLSPNVPAMFLDIHAPLAGDVAYKLRPYDEEENHAALRQFAKGVNWGNFVLNHIWLPNFLRNLRLGIRNFHPA